jgi:hypothetical protein
MKRKFHEPPLGGEYSGSRDDFDLESLLHPAQAFEHPSHVVNDPDLTLNEKRAILASWVSDACAIEAAPALRRLRGGNRLIRFDDVMEALRTLDKEAQQSDTAARYRRILRHGRILNKRSGPANGNTGNGHALH